MATTVVLNIKVNDNELQELETGLKDLGAEFTVVEKGSKKVKKGVDDLGISSKVLSKLDAITGGWASSIIDVATGLRSVVAGLNLSKTALIATGIGAFVVILGTIVAYWDDIVEAVTGVNVELQKQKELSDEINLSLERRNQLEKDNARFLDLQTKEKLLRAKIAGASQDELTQIEREGLENRLKIAEEAAKQADAILERSVGAGEDAYLAAQKEQLKAYDDLAKARSALGIFDLESQLPNKSKGSSKRNKESKVNPLTGEDVDAERERLSNHFRELFDLDKWNRDQLQQSADESNARLLTSEEYAQARRIKLEEEAANAREKISNKEAQAKIESYYLVSDAFAAATELVGESTAAGKAFSVASTLISTYLAAQQAYSSQMLIATPDAPFRAAAAAAVAVVSGLANVKKILSVQIPGQGGSSGVSGGSASTPPAFNVVESNPQNQLNQALLENNNEPVQAFVVEKDVSTAEELRRNKVSSSSL